MSEWAPYIVHEETRRQCRRRLGGIPLVPNMLVIVNVLLFVMYMYVICERVCICRRATATLTEEHKKLMRCHARAGLRVLVLKAGGEMMITVPSNLSHTVLASKCATPGPSAHVFETIASTRDQRW